MKKISLMILVAIIGLPLHLFAGETKTETTLTREKIIVLSAKLNSNSADLIIEGKINTPNPAFFDLATLKKIPPHSFEVINRWTGAKEKYTGVAIIDLLNILGLDGTASSIEVLAANEYRISITLKDLRRYEYILSYKLNDIMYSEHQPKYNKGPLAIAINFDKHPEIDREIYKHHLVWFVSTIVVN